jgi:signal transduction histidine kinase
VKKIIQVYFQLYHFLFDKAHSENRKGLNPEYAHTYLCATIATLGLMWSYAFVAFYYVDHPLPAIVGFVCSIVHLFSPLIVRWGLPYFLATGTTLMAGLLHQAAFSYFTGGFRSNILIWFGFLPFLAGMTTGKMAAFIWSVLSMTASLIFFVAELDGYPFPQLITQTGFLWTQALLSYGWLIAGYIVVVAYLLLKEKKEQDIDKKNHQIRDLLRVLCHDIVNPLSSILSRVDLEKLHHSSKNLDRIEKSAKQISDIINSVRQMEAAESGKSANGIEALNLKDCLQRSLAQMEERLTAKQLVIQNHVNEDIYISGYRVGFETQVLGNLISNSIKFSSIGQKIQISSKCLNSEKVELRIQDYGTGIPADIMKIIFDASAPTTRQGTEGESGTGFGMPIVRAFLHKMQADISIQSKTKEEFPAEHGTIYVLTLTIAPARDLGIVA